MHETTNSVEVYVTDARQRPLPKARIVLKPLGQQEPEPRTLDHLEAAGAFVARAVPPGRYLLQASMRGLEGQSREVQVGQGIVRERFVLGERNLPHYYRGHVRVPFEPPGLLGVTFGPDAASEEVAAVETMAGELGLTQAEEAAEIAAAEGARLYRLPPRATPDATERILGQLDEPRAVRAAGLVLEVAGDHVVFLTRQVVTRFQAHVRDQDVPQIAARFELTVVRKLPYVPNGWLLQATVQAGLRLLELCDQLVQSGLVLYAEPNTVEVVADLAINPTDWLYPEQWHIPIVNLPDAWDTLQAANPPGVSPGDAGDLTFGNAGIVVAIMDRGIESNTAGGVTTAAHPDFAGTVTTGAPKVAQFYDFDTMAPNNDAPPNDHGMGCAAVAGARANNPSTVAGVNEGVVGAAPNCRLLGAIRPAGGTNQQYADAFVWMAGFNPGWTADGVNYPAGTVFPAPPANPGDIISNSYTWSSVLSGVMADMIDFVTSYGRDGRGVTIMWAAGNGNAVCNFGTATNPKVLAVAASSLADDGVTEIRAAYSNFGNVIEFCAPSHDAYVGGQIVHNPPANYGVTSAALLNGGNLPGRPSQHTVLTVAAGPSAGAVNLNVASSAGFEAGQAVLVGVPGAAGTEAQMVVSIPNATTIRVSRLNNAHASGVQVAAGAPDYKNNFGGTSSATPLAAGIAALCLSVAPELSWVELRDILRTTAVTIDFANTDPIGQWIDTTGDGIPNFSQWYGWGRLDANAAVRAARDHNHAVDRVVRDNLADDGTVPSGGWHAVSPDIWTDPNDVPIPVLAYGAAPPHVPPIRGQQNYVFVRVRNVGTTAASDFWVRVLITHFPGFEFRYPQEWTPSNLPGQPVPSPLVPGTYLIGEVALSGLPPGTDTIVKMPWQAALVPDDTVTVGGMTVKWHPCLLADVTPHDGPPPAGATFDVKRYNDLAQRNITIVDPDGSDADLATAVVAGTSDHMGVDAVVIDRSLVPADYRVFVRAADEAVMATWLTLLRAGEVRGADPLPGSQREPGKPEGPDSPVELDPLGQEGNCRVILLDPARVGIRCCDGEVVVVHAPSRTELEFRCAVSLPSRPRVSTGAVQGKDVLFLDPGGASVLELPLRLRGGEYLPLILGLHHPGGLRRAALLFATQRRGDGELSAGYTVEG